MNERLKLWCDEEAQRAALIIEWEAPLCEARGEEALSSPREAGEEEVITREPLFMRGIYLDLGRSRETEALM